MTLADAADEYALLRRLRESSAYQLRRTVALYSAWRTHPATLADLTGPEVSQWLAALETTHAQRTVAGHRVNLLCLWREAADQNAVDPPWKIRRVPRPEPLPIAWTADEWRLLRAACASARGTLDNGATASLYLTTLLDVAYDTGLRRSDLWRLDRASVRDDGTVVMRQRKTGHSHSPRLRQRALSLAARRPFLAAKRSRARGA
jgi:integrase